MRLAVMQPYVFPYLGYFQLIHSVEKFVFYDDVNFIKGGWVHGNRIIVNKNEYKFAVPLSGVSSSKKIKDTLINQANYKNWKSKFLKTVIQNYSKAPYFESVFYLIKRIFDGKYNSISDLAINSVVGVCEYLEMETKFEISSINYSTSLGMDKLERLIYICKYNEADSYVNLSGGRKIYTVDDFRKYNIDLYFIEHEFTVYKQFGDEFKPGLSIIDVLMFKSKSQAKEMLTNYKLL